MTDEGCRVVDVRGRRCPIPVIELARAMEHVPPGGRVQVLADDPTAKVDIPVWCRMKRQRLVEQSDAEGGGWSFLVVRQH